MSILHDATTGKVIPHMRRPRPNLQVSWIQDRHKELRNTWNSRMDSTSDIPLIPSSPRSPYSPHRSVQDRTMNIVLTLPKRYLHHRNSSIFQSLSHRSSPALSSTSTEPTPRPPSITPLMPTTELDAPTSECALPSPVKPSRSGVVQFCQPLPHTSNSRLLSVSHDVSQDDLFHPNDKVVHITVKLPRRRNRKAHKDLESERSEESETMKDLIKMVDCGEVPLPRSRVSRRRRTMRTR